MRPGPVTSIEAAAKHTLRSIARRWQQLHDEITAHEKLFAELTTAAAPGLSAAFGVGADTAAEMLIVAGDNPERVRSEPAWARLCGVAPIPASSGKTNRHRLNRGGHRQANAALYRTVIVRMQHHAPTKAYVARRTAEGKTKAEIIRCLKRLLAREIWALMRPLRETPQAPESALDGYRSINALAETTIGLYETEAVRTGSPFRRGPLNRLADVELLTAEWVHWYNTSRLMHRLDRTPPVEFEARYYTQQAATKTEAHQ